jgi:hypothetical protein
MISTIWFGVITNENNMSATYRRLLNFKNTSYRIIGKGRNNDDEMIIIKFVLVFESPVDFFEYSGGSYSDVFNTIIPVESAAEYIDLVKRITFIESGIHPVTNEIVDDERYFSSDDSEYDTSDAEKEDDDDDYDDDDKSKPWLVLSDGNNEEEEEDDDDDEVESEEEEEPVQTTSQYGFDASIAFFWIVISGLFVVNYHPLIGEVFEQLITDEFMPRIQT